MAILKPKRGKKGVEKVSVNGMKGGKVSVNGIDIFFGVKVSRLM